MSLFCYKAGIYKAYYELGAELFSGLDRHFRNFINKRHVKEYQIPALLEESVLKKCGYIDSFPHQLIKIQSAAHQDLKREDLPDPVYYLTPAACLHLYPMIKEADDTHNVTITTRARVFRRETEKRNPEFRLWDFSVREIVFVGGRDYVQAALAELEQKAFGFALQVSADARVEAATDDFYPTQKNKVKKRLQIANKLKRELLIPCGWERIAVSSFNYHDTHFSQAFGFDKNNSVVTGCVGFGLERWSAVCVQHNYNLKEGLVNES